MFGPMALTVIIALVFAFILSMTFVPAAIAIWLSGPIDKTESRIVGWLGRRYEPGLGKAMGRPSVTLGVAIGALAVAGVGFTTLGQEFLPQLDEGNILVQAVRIRGTSVDQSQAMQFPVEKMLARQPEVRFAFSRTGTSEIASDPMPPIATDTFVILKPRAEWPDPGLAMEKLVERMEKRLSTLPGNAYEITQPIQMRFNELIAGVRGDIAVKVFGDDFGGMNDRPTASPVSSVRRSAPSMCGSSRPRGCRCSTSAPTAWQCRGSASPPAMCRTPLPPRSGVVRPA
nr:AcrB/AcrD/AcrF family [uncultured organism]